MGVSIERAHLHAALDHRLKQTNKCEIKNEKVVRITPSTGPHEKPKVKLEDGTEIEAQLIVGNDGDKSKTREEYGIGAWGFLYD